MAAKKYQRAKKKDYSIYLKAMQVVSLGFVAKISGDILAMLNLLFGLGH